MFLSTVFFRILVVINFIERQKRFGSIWILLRLFVFRISHLVYLLVDGTNSVLLDLCYPPVVAGPSVDGVMLLMLWR